MFGYDDSLDAFGVHAVGGVIGALLTGVFAEKAINSLGSGLIDGNPGQVLIQIYGILGTLIYDAIATLIILYVIKMVIGLRVSEEAERDGLDLSLHGEIVH
jgi:Amt family ammonium transporter